MLSSSFATNVGVQTPASSPPAVPRSVRERIQAMYFAYAADELDVVESLLCEYAGHEEQLLARLVATFGPEPSSSDSGLTSACYATFGYAVGLRWWEYFVMTVLPHLPTVPFRLHDEVVRGEDVLSACSVFRGLATACEANYGHANPSSARPSLPRLCSAIQASDLQQLPVEDLLLRCTQLLRCLHVATMLVSAQAAEVVHALTIACVAHMTAWPLDVGSTTRTGLRVRAAATELHNFAEATVELRGAPLPLQQHGSNMELNNSPSHVSGCGGALPSRDTLRFVPADEKWSPPKATSNDDDQRRHVAHHVWTGAHMELIRAICRWRRLMNCLNRACLNAMLTRNATLSTNRWSAYIADTRNMALENHRFSYGRMCSSPYPGTAIHVGGIFHDSHGDMDLEQDRILSKLHVLDVSTGSMTPLAAALPSPLAYHTLTRFGRDIVVLGNVATLSVEYYSLRLPDVFGISPSTSSPVDGQSRAGACVVLAHGALPSDVWPQNLHCHSCVGFEEAVQTLVGRHISRVMLIFGGSYLGRQGLQVSSSYLMELRLSAQGGAYRTSRRIVPRSPGPAARLYHMATMVDRTMYVFGGAPDPKTTTGDDIVFDDHWKFSCEAQQWTQILPCGNAPTKRGSAAYHAVGSTIYLFGGFDGVSSLSDLYEFSTTTEVWSFVGNLAMSSPDRFRLSFTTADVPGFGSGSCVVDGKHLVVVSGFAACAARPTPTNAVLKVSPRQSLKLLAARWLTLSNHFSPAMQPSTLPRCCDVPLSGGEVPN